jgi:TolB-like protein
MKGALVAVLPFNDNSGKGPDQGRSVADFMLALRHRDVFILVDRLDLQKTLMELELANSGLVNDFMSFKAGAMLSAKFLITGSIGRSGGGIAITARLIGR